MIWESFLDKTIAADANIEAEKAFTDVEKATIKTEEANSYSEEAKHSTKEGKVILLKTKKMLW